MKLGFIGLSRMGTEIARRLNGEHKLAIYNRTRDKTPPLAVL